jgi:hypothetical protein
MVDVRNTLSRIPLATTKSGIAMREHQNGNVNCKKSRSSGPGCPVMTRHQNAMQLKMMMATTDISNRTTERPREMPRLESKYQPMVNMSGSQQPIRMKTAVTI